MKLGELADEAAVLHEEAFCVRYPDPALIFLEAEGGRGKSPLLLMDDSRTFKASRAELETTTTDAPIGRSFDLDRHSRVVFLNAKTTSIGRSPLSDICLKVKTVSRNHAHIDAGPRGWTITDESSSSGTNVDGKPAISEKPTELVDGARVELGPEVVMKFYMPEGLHAFLRLFLNASGGRPPEDLRMIDD